jgi:hypothetical protein
MPHPPRRQEEVQIVLVEKVVVGKEVKVAQAPVLQVGTENRLVAHHKFIRG